jgi:radical SAM protein with 4Fe4S-binding SPASM domain
MQIPEERKQKFMELRARESQNKRHLENCPEVYDKLSVNWDGQVTACCGDWDNQLLVGDLGQESLQSIFTGEKMRRIQKLISEDRYDELPVCRTCFECIELIK